MQPNQKPSSASALVSRFQPRFSRRLVTGTYGNIIINADGSYTYTVDNNNVTVQALRTTSDTLSDVFTYTMRDAGGLTSTTQITVTIQGANDAPVATSETINALEAGGVNNGTAGTSPTGNVLANDTDVDSSANGETLAVTGVAAGNVASASGSVASNVNGLYGSITIAANGVYSYTVNNSDPTVQALANLGQVDPRHLHLHDHRRSRPDQLDSTDRDHQRG